MCWCKRGLPAKMARGLSPALFLSVLSATGSYAFNFGQVSLSNRSHGRTQQYGRCRRQLDMMSSSLNRPAIFVHEDRLRDDGVGGAERARLAESLALEFRVRTTAVEAACEMQLAKQRAAHKVEMAQQRVLLLEGMVPLAAHDEVVSTIAGGFSRRQEELRAEVEQRDKALNGASRNVRAMSDSLAVLKRDVISLRTALNSQDDARRELAAEIRENEVQPQKLRADAAERDLSELRQAAHGWLSAAHALKLEAVAEARESGFAEGRGDLLEKLERSHRERLALSEEVLVARTEAVDAIAAMGEAGAAALVKSRDVWRAEGRAAAEQELLAGEDVASEVREAFAAYVVSAHEQRLAAVARERERAGEAARELSRELARANEMLAALSKERSTEEDRRDPALNEVAAVPAAAVSSAPEKPSTTATLRPSCSTTATTTAAVSQPMEGGAAAAAATAVAAAAAAAAVKLATSSSFWQECGGGQKW